VETQPHAKPRSPIRNYDGAHGDSCKIANLRNLSDPLAHLRHAGPKWLFRYGSFFSNPTLKNLEPRVGFAWDPLHNGRTAVRAERAVRRSALPYQFILLTTQRLPSFNILR